MCDEQNEKMKLDWILNPLTTPTVEDCIVLWTDDDFAGREENDTDNE